VLLLAGRRDDAYPALCRLASELSLQDHIRFLGPVEDVSGLLGALDAGVYSSRAEGSPNAVLEYMAAGLPVVATDIPGIREVVGEAGQRWLAPASDARALAQLILEMLNRPGERLAIGASNRARVEQRYSMRQMCRALTELVATGAD
jgi:glycosyltransferase involved in cell wall biosynthesis